MTGLPEQAHGLVQDDVVTEVRPPGGVVVGDDGSEGAGVALRYALDEARRRGATLHVVRAWSITDALQAEKTLHGYVPSVLELQTAVRAELRARVEAVLGPDVDVTVEYHAVHGPSAQALITASHTADVVVVGTRGRGGFASLVLGSVAEQCIRHCGAPVVVARERPSS